MLSLSNIQSAGDSLSFFLLPPPLPSAPSFHCQRLRILRDSHQSLRFSGEETPHRESMRNADPRQNNGWLRKIYAHLELAASQKFLKVQQYINRNQRRSTDLPEFLVQWRWYRRLKDRVRYRFPAKDIGLFLQSIRNKVTLVYCQQCIHNFIIIHNYIIKIV